MRRADRLPMPPRMCDVAPLSMPHRTHAQEAPGGRLPLCISIQGPTALSGRTLPRPRLTATARDQGCLPQTNNGSRPVRQGAMRSVQVLLLVSLCASSLAFSLPPPSFARSKASFLPLHATAHPDSYADPRQVARSVRPSVALIVPIGVRNSTARGSGFVVEVDEALADELSIYILTAAHVAQPGHRIKVFLPPDGESNSSDPADLDLIPASVVARSPHADLALLKVELADSVDATTLLENHPPLEFGGDEIEVGTPSFAVGYPSGGVIGSAVTSGIVCAIASGLNSESSPASRPFVGESSNKTIGDAERVKKTSYVVTDAAMAGGMSGGPLVDKSGAVIGINALINMELRALGNYAVHVSECRSFISDLATDLHRSREGANIHLVRSGTKENGVDTDNISYRLMLYNDRFNKKERVSEILVGIASLEVKVAEKVMIEAHKFGCSTIKEFEANAKNDAVELCKSLREQDLLVEVETRRKTIEL